VSAQTPTRARRAAMDERFRRRRQEVRRAQARRRRRLTAAVGTLLLLAAVGTAVARSPLFALTDIRVVGTDRAADVRAASGLQPGENLLAADLDAAVADVAALGWVRSASAQRLPPSVVEIAVVPRRPVAVVRLTDSSWLLDDEGVVLAGGTDDDLVVVDAPGSVLPAVGAQTSDAAVRNALAVHAALPPQVRDRVDRYDAPSERGLRLRLAGEDGEAVWVRFGIAERVDTKAEVITMLLGQISEQAARQGEDVVAPGATELDVRAPDNPVLVPEGS
jgi:cell division protein FtsQ